MEITAEIYKIITATIAFTKKSPDQAKLTDLMGTTKELLYILDANKAADYKIAIIEEYLQGVATIILTTDVSAALDYLKKLSTKEQQLAACSDVCKVIVQFFDPEEINPNLVTFWLGRNCDLQEIKSMSALMIFLDPEQQRNVLAYDKTFLQDPKLQMLKNCLAK